MKRTILFPTLPKLTLQSGISIRISEVKSQFESLGLTIKTKGPSDFSYTLVSTKDSSQYYHIAENKNRSKLILDLYTPIIPEKIAYLKTWNPLDWLELQDMKNVVKTMIKLSDLFLVANVRQKKYWLEKSASIGSPIAKTRIFVLPTGDKKRKLGPKYTKEKQVILWFGGIYPWLDPLPLVKAFSKLALKNPDWKLRILGGFHPNTGYKKRFKNIINKAETEIKKNQLEFIPWQKNKNLAIYLKDVAFAVHLPKKTEEDYYAHRVRLLTLSNWGIPIITSGNDLLSDFIVKHKAGIRSNKSNLTKIIQFVINNKSQRTLMSKNASNIQQIFQENQREKKNLDIIFG